VSLGIKFHQTKQLGREFIAERAEKQTEADGPREELVASKWRLQDL
jgi:hypothetical protein